MKIVFLSFSDHEGGASIAANAIFRSLKYKNSTFLTIKKKYNHSFELCNPIKKIYLNLLRFLEKILIFIFLKKKEFHQSLNIFNTFNQKKILDHKPDLINIHWINRSMISLKELNRFEKKIVVSLHDMWFLNSTEHYFYKRNNNDNFLSKYCWKLKKIFLYKKNVFFIAHNKWMFDRFIKLYPKLNKKIFLSKYYPIDTNIFKPRNKISLRKKYKLPIDKKIIFFSAQDISDKRKGYIYFYKIIKKFSNNKNIFFLSIGNNNKIFKNYDNHKHINFLPKNDIAEIYSLSDIFICTSLIDNLPLTILEALSSGNLVFSFDNGASREVLRKTGYIFKFSEIDKIIKKIELITQKDIKKKSYLARQFALNNFKPKKISSQYKKILSTIHRSYVS